MAAYPPPSRSPRPPPAPGWALVFLAAGLAGLLVAGWRLGYLGPHPWAFLYPLALAGWFTATLLAAVAWAWSRLWPNRALQAQYNRELTHLRTWGGEEGRLRREGIIRDLNALGGAPERLDHALLAGADLKGADLTGCDFSDADLHQADLQGACLDRAKFWGADLSGANLTLSTLHGANLRGANLENAELVKVGVAAANFHRANLVNANLYGTDLTQAHVEQARFATREEGELPRRVHASVEDWIREGLDEKGRFAPRKPPRVPPGRGTPPGPKPAGTP